MKIAQDDKLSERLTKRHLPFGVHIGMHASQGGPTNEKLLVQAGFVMLHDGDLRTTLWTAHKLTRDDVLRGKSMDKVKCFRRDKRLPAEHAAIKKDYEEPIFDRGHMAPDRDLRDDLVQQLNSYVLSNIAPQYDRFNSGIWNNLEKRGRDWAKAHETVYVTSGALFDFNPKDERDRDEKAARMGSLHQTARVAITSHFYKVFLRRCENQWCTIAFILEHHNGLGGGDTRQRLQEAIKPLACIEGPAEITFHPELDRAEIRESLDGNGWGLASGTGSSDARRSSCAKG
ncbi:MAG: DNA/RNA non-specific endonuclease [Chloroflexi bacterium]|nr:DNA/RNA non-specific endonuclease [Chloroflexota bacterium]